MNLNNFTIKSQEAIEHAFGIAQGYDPQPGARPLKRLIQKHILNEISRRIISQEVSKNQLIIINAEKSGLSIKNSDL